MKKTFEITKAIATKLIVGALLLAMVGALLVSCGGGGSSKIEVTGVTRNDEDGLSQDNLDKIASLLANNAPAHEAFVAAYRGYNMLLEDFDKTVERPQLETDVEAAKAVLAKYDTEKVLSYEALDAEDVANIVNKLKTDITISSERGFFENIQYWIGVALGWITNTVGFGNYLVGICIFAVIIELLLLPLSIKQQKNSIKQATLRPKEMAIRKKYAGRNDQATQQKVNTEIQELYQRENFNPMGGCLPLLVQFPVIIILYNIVINPLVFVLGKSAGVAAALQTYVTVSKAAGGLGMALNSKNGTIEILSTIREKGASAIEGIKDFAFINNTDAVYAELAGISESIPSFNIGPINFGLTPSITELSWLLVVPVLTFVVYFFSMKLTKKFMYQPTAPAQQDAATGCSTKIMDYSMPLMSVFISFAVPGAVGVYWIFKSVISTAKQFILSRMMPLPKFTEEDYKAAEKEFNSKSSHKKSSGSSTTGAKVRSLHHIDDDDYDQPTPTPAPKSKKKVEEKETIIEKAPLKEDKKESADESCEDSEIK